MAEAVPARIALESIIELWNAIEVPEQDPVHRLASGDQFGAVEYALDKAGWQQDISPTG